MKAKIKVFVIITLLMAPLMINNSVAYSEENGIEDGDRILYGYVLYDEETDVTQNITETQPKNVKVSEETIRPIGLYNAIIGMKEGQKINLIVPPSEGFTLEDETLWWLAGKTIYYEGLEIYKVYPKTSTPGTTPTWLRPILIILGIAAGSAIILLGWHFGKKIFVKRCINCSTGKYLIR